MIAEAIVGVTGSDVHPYVLLTVMFWISAVLTQFMSNTASAALLAPIGFQIASSLSLDPHPIMMAIAVSASAAFVTPVATPPNTLVSVSYTHLSAVCCSTFLLARTVK